MQMVRFKKSSNKTKSPINANCFVESWPNGTKIWRLRAPSMPHKLFFPRQGASPKDGPVKNSTLIITRIGNTSIIEAAIPGMKFRR